MALPARLTDRPVRFARWDPFQEIENTWSRMGSLLSEVMGGFEGPPTPFFTEMMLPVDIEETDDAFVVEIDLPGVRRDDISVDLSDGELCVSGEYKERERKGVLRRRTRAVGRFEHRITLPGEVDPNSVSASLSDGVLTVRLAKTERSQIKHIEVRTEPTG